MSSGCYLVRSPDQCSQVVAQFPVCLTYNSPAAVLQMVSAVIQEDRYEVSLTISFVLGGQERQQVCDATCDLNWPKC